MSKQKDKPPSKKNKKVKFKIIEGTSENTLKIKPPSNTIFIKAVVVGKKSPDIWPAFNESYCKYCNNTTFIKFKSISIKCGCTSPEAYMFTISIVSGFIGVAPHVLRYWGSEFNLIQSETNSEGKRFYRFKDIENFSLIKNMLYKEGLTFDKVKERLLLITK